MSKERLFSFRNVWFSASVGAVVFVAIVAALIGFVWIPSTQGGRAGESLWDMICSAAGVVAPATLTPMSATPPTRPSNVIVTAQMMETTADVSIGRGATLAQQCTMCHGTRGISQANMPNLAAQDPASIYKQLRDYKSGHRQSAIMRPMAAGLSDRDMRDIAAYYASLPAAPPPEAHPEMPVLVRNGAPMRNIGACATCHGPIAKKTAAPYLRGQPADYLRDQLQRFASGERRNDLNAQMRNAARQMTPEEIDEVVRYYAQTPR